jgi:triosephosphate isomerase (TIM)
MRLPIIAGNWKMNTTIAEAISLVKEMLGSLDKIAGVEKVLCPPFISLSKVSELISGTSIKLGAQNLYYEEKGAYTGEISQGMLAGLCEYVILGHSERRGYFGETDEIVSRKVKAALKAGIKPILCVGENLQVNEAGETTTVITGQVRASLDGVDSPQGLVIAYEPIWAIGTGKAATAVQANAVIGIIRHTISELYGEDYARAIRIQYGGSVTGANAAEFMSQSEIDGALVGGASLKVAEFLTLTEKSSKAQG